jgi:hypothetical protein
MINISKNRPITYFSKGLFLWGMFFLFSLGSFGQKTDSLKFEIELGKKGNFLFSRKISFHNMGVYSSPFARIFFKESKFDEYKSIGFLGRKIKPIIQENPLALIEFKKYRNYKLVSYAALASVLIITLVWFASANYFNRRVVLSRRRGPINLVPDGTFYLFPFSITGMFISSILLNQQADQHLLMSTEISNRKIKTLRPKN